MEQKLKEVSLHLLDLGKRNRLINYKTSGYRTIEVLNDNIEEIFTKLINGSSLSIFQLDSVLQAYHQKIDETGQSIEEYSLGKVKDIFSSMVKPNEILCYKKGYTVTRILKTLYKEYKNSLLEKGINTLYMTFGLVEYSEKNETYLAPLLLVPLSMDFVHYKIQASEDEIVVNPTLAYYLESEYHIHLEEFQENEISLQEYFSKISQLLSQQQFKLHLQISIGIYSFLKMNMFHDLRQHTETILQNQNILQILGNSETQVESPNLTEPIFPVIDADESQMQAIQYAANGASFVLQGPPGTGKSQTITNMIASLIGNGKKVLFVSEKQAALNVVYENLRRAELESFAIELHSHKTNKKDFISELYKTAILPRYQINQDREEWIAKYGNLTSILEEYRTKLHQKIDRVHRSMYEMYSSYLKVSSDFQYHIEKVEQISIETLDSIKHNLDQYATLSTTLGYDYTKGPFYGFISRDTVYIRYEAKQDFEQIYQFFQNMLNVQNMLMRALPFTIHSYKNIVDAMPYLDKIIQINFFLPEFFIKEEREKLCQRIIKYNSIIEKLNKSTLKNFLDLKIIRVNGLEELVSLFEQYSQKPLKFFLPKYHQIKKEINKYTKLKMKDRDILSKLKEAIEYKKQTKVLSVLKTKLPQGYRSYELDVIYHDAVSLNELPFSLHLTETSYAELKRNLLDISIEFQKVNTLPLAPYIDKFDSQILDFISGDISSIVLRMKDMVASIDKLDIHAQRVEVLERLKNVQALPFLDAALKEKLGLKKLSSSYEFSFWQANILYEIDKEPIFKEFSSFGVETILHDFQQLDSIQKEMNKAYIISKLSNCRPDDSIMIGSKFAVLVREYNKTRKQKPIRMILEELFDLVLDIKPVFLMSPLSVSTYLNSKLNLFDTVIFDEASQVFAWDALGAIYRAKQCIIIGDNKQMPPSNFFTSMVEEDEDYENDMESILDKGSSVFQTKRLNWHYRSRSEELIAFSNTEFYDDRLITIPQAKKHTPGFGIDFHYVYGTYEVKARTNLAEAKYIVDLVFQHIQNRKNESLGVVAFSNAQADLISDLIDAMIEERPETKSFFDETKREPFFVKNLESVQGDERDVIIFSICFGYTKDQKFYQRFGPLNVLGGERRLNVAITRAKVNVCVVSSIHASDIKVEQTDSIGVRMLKKYLDYAERISTPKVQIEETSDGLISSITHFLNKAGYVVHTKIGSSSFKIDCAVLDKKTQEYTAAIMVDGPSYLIGNCSDANALQEKLLTRFGWKFLRIFSTQWVQQPKLEQERILHFLKFNLTENCPRLERENYLIEIQDEFDASFKEYPKVSNEKIEDLYHHKKPLEVIRYILDKEGPIHIDYLLKRICFMYGRTKVTALVREYFEQDLEDLEVYRDQDFLSLQPIMSLEFRISNDRAIEYVHREELKDAIYKIVKKSNGITKQGCFKKVLELLGYTRMSDGAIEHLDEALVFLKLDGKIEEKQDCLYS